MGGGYFDDLRPAASSIGVRQQAKGTVAMWMMASIAVCIEDWSNFVPGNRLTSRVARIGLEPCMGQGRAVPGRNGHRDQQESSAEQRKSESRTRRSHCDKGT